MAEDSHTTLFEGLELLREFLDSQDRPTVIVDCLNQDNGASKGPSLLYYNPQYKAWIHHCSESRPEISKIDIDNSFKHFAEDAALWDTVGPSKTSSVIHVGITWVASRVGGKWGVLQMRAPFKVLSPDNGQSDRPRKRARIFCGDDTSSTSSQTLNLGCDPKHILLSPDPSLSTPANERSSRVVDWTRYDVPECDDFVKWLRQYNWGTTKIGPMERWSSVVRQNVFFIMSNPEPRCMYIGHDNPTMMYNEACSKLLGDLHPNAMGVSGAIGAGPAWEYKYRGIKKVLETGVAHRETNHYHPIPRDGLLLKEGYYSWCTMPIIDNNGDIFGVLKEFYETTTTVIKSRRRATIQRAEIMDAAGNIATFWAQVREIIDSNPQDFPFCLMYSDPRDSRPEKLGLASIEDTVPGPFNLEGVVGLQDSHPMVLGYLDISNSEYPLSKEFRTAWITRRPVLLQANDGTLPEVLQAAVDGRGHDSACHSAIVYPINRLDGPGAVGLLLLGLNPQRHFDLPYREFLKYLIDQFIKSAASILVPGEREKLLQSKREAKAQEREFTKLAELAPVGCAIFQADGKIKYSNSIFDSLSTLRNQKNLSFRECIPFHPHDREQAEDIYAQLSSPSSPKKTETFQFRVRKAWSLQEDANSHHQWRWLLAHSSLIPSSNVDEGDGVAASVITYLTDITPEKREQGKTLEDAMEIKRKSDNFIDMTCHEIRNPFSAVMQSADSILSAYESESLQKDSLVTSTSSTSVTTPSHVRRSVVEAAQTILLCAQHQKRIVDDILTISKLESSSSQISPDRVQATAIVEQCIRMYQRELADAQISASFTVNKSYKELQIDHVFLDPARLLQILINLLTNAIKFTRSESTKRIEISISASLQPPSLGSGNVSFIPSRESRDLEMPESEWGTGEVVFLLFNVGDTGKGMTQGEIARLFHRFSQASPKTFSHYGGSGLGLFISRGLAELHGGQIGVSSVPGEGTTFAFYIETRRCIPESPSQSGVLNNESVTSIQPIKRSLSASMAYAEAEMPGVSTVHSEATSGPSALPLPDLHILLVEDNLINQRVTALQLRKAGCTVHVANHGGQCLEFLERSCFYREIPRISINDSATQSPTGEIRRTPLSVILLDQEMPVMDGLTCVKKIRAMQEVGDLIAHVPVIACTGTARREQIVMSLEAGMDEVITKPFRITEILAKIESLLNRIQASSIQRILDE